MKQLSVILLCALVAWVSCRKKDSVVQKTVETTQEVFSSDSLASHLMKRLSDRSGLAPCIEEFRFVSMLRLHYAQQDYSSFLITEWSANQWNELDSLMSDLPAQGLDARMYHYPLLLFYLDSLEKEEGLNYGLMAQIEFLCAHALLELSHDLRAGRLNPKELFGDYYHIPYEPPKANDILRVFTQGVNDLRTLFLKDEESSLLAAYRSVLKEKERKGERWPVIDFSRYSKIEEGDHYKGFSRIGERLYEEGIIDSAEYSLFDTDYFNTEAVGFIKRFQESRNLFNDGVIGTNTQEALNRSISERIAEIDANFERKRWLREISSLPMLRVNLPDYRLHMLNGDTLSSMKVCIGSQRPANYNELIKLFLEGKAKSKPKNHETPQVYSKVSHLVLNPTWTVPRSIVMNEMLGKMRRDPTYLKRNHYIILRNGKQVSYDSVNWKQVNPGGYTIRQTPGPHNALGKIKFMFVNPFNVYMHDTPSQGPFSFTERDVSHGCVRLEKPIELADFIGKLDERIDADQIRTVLGYPALNTEQQKDSLRNRGKSSDTKVMHLATPIPVLFDYRTIFMDNDGKLQIRFDMYRKQAIIYNALKASY